MAKKYFASQTDLDAKLNKQFIGEEKGKLLTLGNNGVIEPNYKLEHIKQSKDDKAGRIDGDAFDWNFRITYYLENYFEDSLFPVINPSYANDYYIGGFYYIKDELNPVSIPNLEFGGVRLSGPTNLVKKIIVYFNFRNASIPFSGMFYNLSDSGVTKIKIENNESFCPNAPFMQMIPSSSSTDLKEIEFSNFYFDQNRNPTLDFTNFAPNIRNLDCLKISIAEPEPKNSHTISQITIPENIKKLDLSNSFIFAQDSFRIQGSSNAMLEDVDLSNSTIYDYHIYYMFSNIPALKKISFNNTSFMGDQIEQIFNGGNFNSLSHIDFSNFNIVNNCNFHKMFDGLTSLKSIDLESFNFSNQLGDYLREIFGDSSLEEIYVLKDKWNNEIQDTNDIVKFREINTISIDNVKLAPYSSMNWKLLKIFHFEGQIRYSLKELNIKSYNEICIYTLPYEYDEIDHIISDVKIDSCFIITDIIPKTEEAFLQIGDNNQTTFLLNENSLRVIPDGNIETIRIYAR